MITAHEVVQLLIDLIVLEIEDRKVIEQLREPAIRVDTNKARIRLAEALDAWRNQAPWPTRRQSPFDRARRDPVFNALVQHLHHFMATGEGQFTPTEVREAAMVAQMILEQERPLVLGLPPTPPEPRTSADSDRRSP